MAADHPTTSLNYPNHAAASFRNVHLDLTPSSVHLQADPPVGSAGLPVCARSYSV
jgi:hypothetical protein